MVRLPDGGKALRICITIYTQYRRVTDGQTDILPRHSPRYAYASHDKNERCVNTLTFTLLFLCEKNANFFATVIIK